MLVVDDCSFYDFFHDIISIERHDVAAFANTFYSTKLKIQTLRKQIICFCLPLQSTDVIYLDKNLFDKY